MITGDGEPETWAIEPPQVRPEGGEGEAATPSTLKPTTFTAGLVRLSPVGFLGTEPGLVGSWPPGI
jgi:hypothetical protein